FINAPPSGPLNHNRAETGRPFMGPEPRRSRIASVHTMSFRGIIPPIITPFAPDGSIDRDGFAAVMEHLIASGVHGIVIGGTTGEYYAQSRDERVGLLKLAQTVAK